MQDQKNTILAIVLSAIVLIGWQYFFATPQANRQRQLAEQQRQEQVEKQAAAPAGTAGSPAANTPQTPGQAGSAAAPQPREKVLAATPRVEIDTPSVKGSIDLRGARLDDLSLVKYRETVDPNSPIVVLLAPSGTEEPFYAEFGWIAGAGMTLKLPNADTVWRQDGSGALQVGHPVTLVYDNGEGLEFHRTIGVDDKYLFTIEDSVSNKGTAPVTLYPYGLISRHGTPKTLGYYILHEGFIGVLDGAVQEKSYKSIEEKRADFNNTKGWLGITDKYWAATLLPDPQANLTAEFSADTTTAIKRYQTSYFLDSHTVAPGATTSAM
ncbi:MAG: membrane protein insertase YidC, partial [Xanthobacteraceae bacterium]